MHLFENQKYIEDVRRVADAAIGWEKLKDCTILLSGGTGLLGSFFVDVIAVKNEQGLNCQIYALGRNMDKAKMRFIHCWDKAWFQFIPFDVNSRLVMDEVETIDYVLHLASNTHPIQYSTDPIGTISTNIIGLQNMLDFSIEHEVRRFAFASSNEVYGENRGDVELFKEDYCGYINCNTLRAGYPESKRCGEALCQAYRRQKGLNIVIPRFTRSYGPTMQMTDTKAISQFIKRAIEGKDIILKSEGTQYYSYTYVGDAVLGLLYILLYGEDGEAYNIADQASDVMLKDLAAIIAESMGKKVVFELPEAVEALGYSTATKARLDGQKLHSLGWTPYYSIESGITRTIKILHEMNNTF